MGKNWPLVSQFVCALISSHPVTPASAAETESEAPYTGTYYCYTTALVSDPHANNVIGVRPAFFGKLVLDGRGGYTLTAKGQQGRYVYEPRQGKLSFSGTLSAAQVSGYSADSFKLNYRGPNGTFAFNCTTDGVGDARSSQKASPENVQRLVAGQFVGEYACTPGGRVAITIQLSSDDDNNLQGVVLLKMGGPSSWQPVAKYSVAGRWFKEAVFSIRPDTWLENPSNLPLPTDWMTGQVEESGLSHIKKSDTCPNFSLKRVR
jgi:hypothetical protein